jgi:magnesium-transporting ATPase (P-type)
VGDIILVDAGDKIAADGLLSSAHGLMVDEELLSGETVGVQKSVQDPWCRSGTKVRALRERDQGEGTV